MIVLGLKLSTDSNTEHSVIKKIFDTGCVPSNLDSTTRVLWNVLEQSGGQVSYDNLSIAKTQDYIELYLTVGDFKLLSKNKDLLSQKGISSGKYLGTIFKIRVSGGTLSDSRIETTSAPSISGLCAQGIRNPQGLTLIKSNGKNLIAATSHGPRGGDTLMMFDCKKTINYGWPDFSLGTSYTGKSTDYANNIRTEGSVPIAGIPAWSWTPSIGPSALIQISKNGKFSRWWTDSKNASQDLIVSGMAAKKLFRLRSYEGKIIGMEDIYIGERCRALVEMDFGSLICGLDSNKLLILKHDSEWNSSNGGFSG